MVDLRFLPNDAPKARKCSYETTLQSSLWVYNMDILPGLISKACIMTIFYLSQTSFLCLLFVALCPYVSMAIVTCLGQLLAIVNGWTDLVLITSLWESYMNFCHLFTNESGDSILDCIPCLIEWGSSDGVNLLVNSYWLFWPCLAVLCLVAKF